MTNNDHLLSIIHMLISLHRKIIWSDKMQHIQFNIKRINMLKDILLRLRQGESLQHEVDQYFKNINVAEVLLIEQQLLHSEYGITVEDIKKLSSIHPHLYIETMDESNVETVSHQGHPVQIFKRENKTFQSCLKQISYLLDSFEREPEQFLETDMVEVLKKQVFQLGEFHKHYHRKEKLFFPILERYGYFDPTKIMWRGDDRIRALYKGTKNLIDKLPRINVDHVRVTYDAFVKEFKKMIFQEEAILLPVLVSIFQANDWYQIARESEAFGYAMIEVEEKWVPDIVSNEDTEKYDPIHHADRTKDIRFGGGYLTIEEANLILNNLPLEITFVDKNSVFKYFNEITEASDMMLVRTPISIGRNVANCHPPKSLQKVMTIVRDLKTKKRTSESMWYKKGDQYIHITYKALFNEYDEFLGILEYVQDIQPFFDLPKEVKTSICKL